MDLIHTTSEISGAPAGTPTIGLIGLGIMGKPMARNLRRAGYPLIVHDVVSTVVDELVAEGANSAGSPREVAAACDVLITMLPDSPQVRSVYLGPGGVFEALRPGWMAIDMSAIAPSTARGSLPHVRVVSPGFG